MAKTDNMRLDVYRNNALRRVEIVMLRDGARVDSISFTLEQAVNHVKAIIDAVDSIQGKGSSGLIVPDVPKH